MSELNKIWLSIIAPFKVIGHHKHDFLLWFIYVVVAGLLGIIINVVKLWIFDGEGFQKSLTYDSQSGSFYTFSLVICASLIWPIFKSLTSKEQPEYFLIRTILLTILIFTDLFCAIFYAFSNINSHKCFFRLRDEWYPIDLPQLVFFLIAIMCSIYSFGLSYLPKHSDKYKVSDEHLKSENTSVGEIRRKLGNNTGSDSEFTDSETQKPIKI